MTSTHDTLSADRAPPAGAKAKQVAEFYDMRPGEIIESDAFRQARQLRAEWRRQRYARLARE